jgi:hypothetical protein
VSESHPLCHGYNRAWFVSEVRDYFLASVFIILQWRRARMLLAARRLSNFNYKRVLLCW